MATVISGADEVATRFEQLFGREVAPRLEHLEALRQTQRSRTLRIVGLVAAGELVLLLITTLFGFGLAFALFSAAGVALVGFVVVHAMQQTYRNSVRETVMPAICEAIGDLGHTTGSTPNIDLNELEELGVVPGHNRRHIDDVFRGRHRDTDFTMAEVKLRRRGSRNSSRTVFRGLVFAIATPHEIPARILIAKDSGLFGNRIKGWFKSFDGMQRIGLPHEAFEKRFEIYADQPDVALETVSPAFCENLLALADAHDGAPFQAAFQGPRFYLALPKKGDQFRLGSLFRPSDNLEQEARRVLDDVRRVHRLIDFLHGDRPGDL